MKQIFIYILAAICIFAVAACEKSTESEGKKPSGSSSLQGVTIEVIDIVTSATTAQFSYKVDLGEASDMPIDVMLRYSYSENFSGSSTQTVKLEKGDGIYVISGLLFDRDYYYELYLSMYGTDYNGKNGGFKTKDVSVVMSEPSESSEGLTLSGKIEGVSVADVSEFKAVLNVRDIAYGVVCEYNLSLADDMTFTKTVDGLDIGTAYTYWVDIRQGTQEPMSSEKKTYTTNDPYVDAEVEFAGAATDLSADGAANCYIVSSSGIYKFSLVKGNSNESVGAVTSVRVLWESFGTAEKPAALDLICGTFKDGEYAVFEVPQTFREGNAVIAAYDAQDNILWSWHIWLTDPIAEDTYYTVNPTTQEFTTEVAGVVMDRNLGALSNEPNEVGSFGLMYQWGRKDPFVGSAYLMQNSYAAATRRFKAVPGDSDYGNQEFATKNPNVFIAGNEEGDWLTQKNNGLWRGEAKTKTENDPCPPGWRIPDGGTGLNNVQAGLWAKIGLSAYGKTDFPNWYQRGWKGMTFQISDDEQSSWYPLAGGIGLNTELKLVGVDGTYWTNLPVGGDKYEVYAMNFYITGETSDVYYAFCSAEIPRATGNSVRCCKE